MSTLKSKSNAPLYGDWYTGCGWVSCYILVHRGGVATPSPLLAVPNVTARPPTTSVPTSCYSTWHHNYLCPLRVSNSTLASSTLQSPDLSPRVTNPYTSSLMKTARRTRRAQNAVVSVTDFNRCIRSPTRLYNAVNHTPKAVS